MDENETIPTQTNLTDYEEAETHLGGSSVPPQNVDPLALCSQAIRDLVAEYHELARLYPPPNVRDVFADARWVDEVRTTPEFVQYRGKYVAVANRQVHAAGDTDVGTRVATAKASHLHPERFWITYLEPDPWADWPE